MIDIHIGLWDLLLIYLLPILLFGMIVFFGLLMLYIMVRLPGLDFDFKYDLLHIFESQKNLKRLRGKTAPFFRFYFKTLLGDNGTQAILLYRVSRFLHLRGFRLLSDAIHRFSKFVTDSDLSPFADIGRGLLIYHGSGVVIGKNTKLGERCLVCQGVTTGSGAPRIGNQVKLWAGAKVLGNIEIGDDCEIGANAVVLKSVPPNCIAVGVPANRIIPKSPSPTAP